MAEQCKTLTDAWQAALAWVLHLDRESIEAQRQAVMNRARQPRKEPPAKNPSFSVFSCLRFPSPVLR